jgi:hypothetical protein
MDTKVSIPKTYKTLQFTGQRSVEICEATTLPLHPTPSTLY